MKLTNYIFISAKEYDAMPHYPRVKEEEEFNALWEKFPTEQAAALAFFQHEKKQDEKRKELYKKNRGYYIAEYFPMPEHLWNTNTRKYSHYCIARILGEALYNNWKMNTPEVIKDINKTRAAGIKWYEQFINDELRIDYLDNLKNRDEYGRESKKIELGVKTTYESV